MALIVNYVKRISHACLDAKAKKEEKTAHSNWGNERDKKTMRKSINVLFSVRCSYHLKMESPSQQKKTNVDYEKLSCKSEECRNIFRMNKEQMNRL